MEQKKKKKAVEIEREAETDRYPLIMAVRGYCVWEKVVIEVGANPWKSKPEWLSENNDSYDGIFLMWALC